MQLELPLADPPAAQAITRAQWDQLDPAQRQALVQRLAKVIAKTVTTVAAEGDEHE